MSQTEEKFYYRPIPCAACDVDCMETWLSEMALEGLFLTKDGFFCGFGIFQQGQARRVRYRFVPAAKRPSIWDANNGQPEEYERSLRERYGWEYLTPLGDFHIYQTEDPYTVDPPYDHHARAKALKALIKRYRGSVFSSILTGFVFTSLLDGKLLKSILYVGTWRSLFAFAVLLSFLMTTVFKSLHYRRFLRRMQEDDGFRREPADWRGRAKQHWLLLGAQIAAVCLLIGMLLSLFAAEVEEDSRLPMENFPGEPPFATLADLAVGDIRFIRDNTDFLTNNTYREWSDPLAPRIIDWHEHGDFYNTSGGKHYAGLYVDYYETATPWLAHALAWEYWWEHWLFNMDYREHSIPSAERLGLDYAKAFKDKSHLDHVVLQKGNRVYHVYGFAGSGAFYLSTEELVTLMAAALK